MLKYEKYIYCLASLVSFMNVQFCCDGIIFDCVTLASAAFGLLLTSESHCDALIVALAVSQATTEQTSAGSFCYGACCPCVKVLREEKKILERSKQQHL